MTGWLHFGVLGVSTMEQGALTTHKQPQWTINGGKVCFSATPHCRRKYPLTSLFRHFICEFNIGVSRRDTSALIIRYKEPTLSNNGLIRTKVYVQNIA